MRWVLDIFDVLLKENILIKTSVVGLLIVQPVSQVEVIFEMFKIFTLIQ